MPVCAISPLFSNLLSPKPTLHALVALHTEDGQPSILASLCQSEEYGPEYALGSCADGQEHLSKRQNIKRNAAQQHDDSRAKRKSLQPFLDVIEYLHTTYNLASNKCASRVN